MENVNMAINIYEYNIIICRRQATLVIVCMVALLSPCVYESKLLEMQTDVATRDGTYRQPQCCVPTTVFKGVAQPSKI